MSFFCGRNIIEVVCNVTVIRLEYDDVSSNFLCWLQFIENADKFPISQFSASVLGSPVLKIITCRGKFCVAIKEVGQVHGDEKADLQFPIRISKRLISGKRIAPPSPLKIR